MVSEQRPPWLDFHYRATVVDVHAHPDMVVALFHEDLTRRNRIVPPFFWPRAVRTSFPALQQGGVDVLLSAIYVPEKRLAEDIWPLHILRYFPSPYARHIWKDLFGPSYFTVTTNLLDDFERQIEGYKANRNAQQRPVRLAHSVADLDGFVNQGQAGPIALVHTIEGAHALQGETGSDTEILGNLQTLFDRGVALITLAHFYPNGIVQPVFPYPESMLDLIAPRRLAGLWADSDLTRGLTHTGEQVVEKMAELGMIIDISHSTPPARRRIYEIAASTGKPSLVVASHVGAYAVNPSPYNLEDWEIAWIADHGGIVGVLFMNYWLMPHETKLGINFISRTIEQFVTAAGGRTDHVAFGSDFDGFTDPPDDLKDASELPRLTARLFAELGASARRKYADDDIENILGRNALRVLRTGWGKKA